jgi:hypothetical protein
MPTTLTSHGDYVVHHLSLWLRILTRHPIILPSYFYLPRLRPLFYCRPISSCRIAHGGFTPAIRAIGAFAGGGPARAWHIGYPAGRAYRQAICPSRDEEQFERNGPCEPPTPHPDGWMLGILPIQKWHDMHAIEPLLYNPAEAKARTSEIKVCHKGGVPPPPRSLA